MKKIIASAVGLMLVGGVAATSAFAVESQFGGYWRTNYYFRDNFVQPDSSFNAGENRTRLFYTAKFNDNFKFYNAFEFDTSWGDNIGGDLGSDGNVFELKHSYADFTLGMLNFKLGIQPAVIGRHFIFDNDFSGAVVTADFGMVKVPFVYAAVAGEDVNKGTTTILVDKTTVVGVDAAGDDIYLVEGAQVTGAPAGDIHLLSVMPKIQINDNISITPNVTWMTETHVDSNLYWLGLDADVKFDAVSAWGSVIYQGGKTQDAVGDAKIDKDAWLVAAGADAGIVHGQAFYATGDDGKDATENNAFTGASPSYYWSEIMGLGIFDLNGAAPSGSPGDAISNIWAANVGVTVKPVDKLTFDFDVWYAALAEDNAAGDNELGLEFDGVLSYEIMDNLTGKLVFAYLVAGDATGPNDIMEGGVQISLKF